MFRLRSLLHIIPHKGQIHVRADVAEEFFFIKYRFHSEKTVPAFFKEVKQFYTKAAYFLLQGFTPTHYQSTA